MRWEGPSRESERQRVEAGAGPRDVGPADVSADEAFGAEILPKVSRTFALSIEALPAGLQAPVRVAYLLCRIVDTIEDEADLDPARRQQLFDAFDDQTRDDGADPAAFEATAADLGRPGAERRLCRGAGAVFRTFRGLPPEVREAMRPHVLEMSTGMREYAARADAEGALRIRDLEDLERYCYFVAGTVGNLLTALFEQAVPGAPPETVAVARENTVGFGLGLQLVNIVKDVATDLERGVCFLPETLLERHGVRPEQLLDPQARDRGLAVVHAVTGRAREHLAQARVYTLAWPVPEGLDLRLFCAVPLALALATLSEVERGTGVLRPGVTPKVDRATVAQVLQAARLAVTDDRSLEDLFARVDGSASV